jgi:rsbT co-antagonist protein RsbR
MTDSRLPTLLRDSQADVLAEWIKEQTRPGAIRPGLIRESELKAQCEDFLSLLAQAAQRGNLDDITRSEYAPVRDMLDRISRTRAEQGFSASETATFVLSLKRPLFARLRKQLEHDPNQLLQEVWTATELIDKIALLTTEAYQKGRETVISRQQSEMLELSTPVVKLWEGVLALPLIGTLDSNRTQIVMETLLQRVVETGSEIVIIDITGVPTVDTLVAQHLLKTIAAARLMGVECIISGIRPQIAQTIVHLGVALGEVTTKASLADAFKLALGKRGLAVARNTTTSA